MSVQFLKSGHVPFQASQWWVTLTAIVLSPRHMILIPQTTGYRRNVLYIWSIWPPARVSCGPAARGVVYIISLDNGEEDLRVEAVERRRSTKSKIGYVLCSRFPNNKYCGHDVT
jgi:hypothetical protein